MSEENPTLPDHLQNKTNYELWIISQKKFEKEISNLPEKEIVNNHHYYIGTCCFCKQECNALSQMCGHCMRELNHF